MINVSMLIYFIRKILSKVITDENPTGIPYYAVDDSCWYNVCVHDYCCLYFDSRDKAFALARKIKERLPYADVKVVRDADMEETAYPDCTGLNDGDVSVLIDIINGWNDGEA